MKQRMPMADELRKLANLPEPPPDSGQVPDEEARQEPDIKYPILHALKAVAAPAAAFGVGTAAGALAGRGISHALGAGPGAVPAMRKVAPFLGGMMGLSLQQYHSRANKELSRAYQAHKSQSAGAVSGE